jgi:hypothetical protein
MTGPSDIHTVNLSNGDNFIITIEDRSKSKNIEYDTREHKKVFDLLDKCKESIEKNTGFTENGVKAGEIAVKAAKKALSAKDAESIAKADAEKAKADAEKAKADAEKAKKNTTNSTANQTGGFFGASTAVIVEKGNGDTTYTYAGEVTNTNTIEGYGVIILGQHENGKSRDQILSQDTYSYAGEFVGGQKNGFGIETGLEKLSSATKKHYYVGKFDNGKRCGGAYAIGSDTVYIGDFGKGTSTFNGFGCWRQGNEMVFGEFIGESVGAVDAKFKYPLIYVKDKDIRRYDDASSFCIFQDEETENIRKKIDSIEVRKIYSAMGHLDKFRYELKNPIQSMWNISTTSTGTKVAFGVGAALLGALGWAVYKYFKKKPAADGKASDDNKSADGKASSDGSKAADALSNSNSARPLIKTEKKERVTKAQLQAKARELGIEFKNSDTMAKLQSLIAAKSGASNRRTMRKSRGSRSRR